MLRSILNFRVCLQRLKNNPYRILDIFSFLSSANNFAQLGDSFEVIMRSLFIQVYVFWDWFILTLKD